MPAPTDSRDGSVLEYCRQKHITIQTWSPLQYGQFQGVFLGNEKYPELNAELNRLAEAYDVEPAATTRIELTREQWYSLYRAAGNVLP